MKPCLSVWPRALAWWGACLCLAALALNEVTLLGATPQEGDAPLRWLVRGLDACLVTWGVATLALRRRAIVAKVNVAVFTLLVAGPVVGELGLRLATTIEGSPLRHPKHFADHFSDDDYWKLFIRWVGKWVPAPERVHPQLGWSQQAITPSNPLGLTPATQARLAKDGRRKIAFYGDSFVAGLADPGFTIPEVMARGIDWADVLDLGVGGYGLDQMLLFMQETLPLADRPIVVLGLMTQDLDRAILSVRTGRKPRFIVSEDGELVLTGVPIERDQARFYAEAPLAMRSFFAAFVATQSRRIAKRFDPTRPEKERLNRALLDRLVSTTRDRGLQLACVIFYPPDGLRQEDWRESFLKRELMQRGCAYLDTKPLLLAYCVQQPLPTSIDDLYAADGGHHNTLANRLIGEEVVRWIRRLGLR